MDIRKPGFIIEIVDGNIVVGEITRWEKYVIDVVMVSPYLGWEEHLMITGWLTILHYRDFLTDYGENRARLALITCYKKAHILYSDLERFTWVYGNLKKELLEVDKIDDVEIRETIKAKLMDWFFNVAVFSSLSTGLYATKNDRMLTFKILDDYVIRYNKE